MVATQKVTQIILSLNHPNSSVDKKARKIMLKIKSIDAKTAHEWLCRKEAILIDVREPEEYNTIHILGASLIPVGSIEANKLPPQASNKKIIVHCKLGKRGDMACEKLLSENPNLDVYNIEGGIDEWKRCGLPVEINKNAPMDIMRQVQITAGILVLLGVILSLAASFYFIFLSGFVGLGLLFSGITGYCGMAKLLMRMPWNKK